MAKSIKKLSEKTTNQTTNDNIPKEYVKELEDQLIQLKIENAFLKEMRRLCLEEEAQVRKRQESYAVSEKNSDQKIYSYILKCQKQHICTGKRD